MTLLDIINTLKGIALNQPEIRGVSDGDVYEALNGNPSLKYSVFHVTQTSHSTNDGWDTYGLSLFIIDRLMDDSSNRLEIQSRAKETLNNIIYTFCQNFDAEHNTISFTPFTQKFKDNTAGVWCNVNISVLADTICPLDYAGGSYYPSVTVIDNLDIYIKETGVYEVPEGYTGYGTITVDFPIQPSINVELNENKEYTIEADPEYAGVKEINVKVDVPIQESKKASFTDNGSYTVTKDDEYAGVKEINVEVNVPIQESKTITVVDNIEYTVESDPEYKGMKRVNIEVDVPLQTKDIFLNENALYSIQPDPEYKGIEDLTISVNVPIPQIEPIATLSLKEGDKGTLLPSEGYDALQGVNYEVSKGKMKIPNGICLSGSTFTTFDGSNWDWSLVYDCAYMFSQCKNLTEVTNIPLKPKNCYSMFYWCDLIAIDMSDWDFSEVYDLGRMFYMCQNLKEVKMAGSVDKLASCADMFKSVGRGGQFYYPAQYDYSKIIAELPDTWTAVPY